MLNKNIAIAVAVVLALVCLAEAREEGPHDMADALRMLQELDRYYTQAARPRKGRDIAWDCNGEWGRLDIMLGENCLRSVDMYVDKLDEVFVSKLQFLLGVHQLMLCCYF
uniref:SFRICE_004335 n=1 Tax=Spodoptera frugiperda TaxID=7108 RepID=A0A2H1WDY0_SPOFR